MEFIFHNSFDQSCRLYSALLQRYRIPNSRKRVKSGPRPKNMNKPIKVHIEALDVVLEVIYSQVIILKTIVKLSQLRDISTEKLERKLGLQIPATGVKIYRET